MEKSEFLSPDKIRSGQELIKSKIFERAKSWNFLTMVLNLYPTVWLT